jgi:nucleotide-binding universal stress UspA family protein
MASWKRFCCAIDFSEPSRLAAREASELARRFEGELELLHVHLPPPPAVAIEAIPAAHDVTAALAELRDMMSTWQEEAARLSHRPVHATVISGIPGDEIVRFARERPVDALVLGTHGRKGLPRLLLGSVAERVVREAPCAVVVVRVRE